MSYHITLRCESLDGIERLRKLVKGDAKLKETVLVQISEKGVTYLTEKEKPT